MAKPATCFVLSINYDGSLYFDDYYKVFNTKEEAIDFAIKDLRKSEVEFDESEVVDSLNDVGYYQDFCNDWIVKIDTAEAWL